MKKFMQAVVFDKRQWQQLFQLFQKHHFFCAKVAVAPPFLAVGVVSSDDPSSFSVILFVFLRLLDSIVVVRFGIAFLLLLSKRL